MRLDRTLKVETKSADAFESGVADILVVGAGFAGALAALVMARRGYKVLVIDPHPTYPEDFRCEKFSEDQVALIKNLGVEDCFLKPYLFGTDVKSMSQQGFRYQDGVNALRQAWGQDGCANRIRHVIAKVKHLNPDAVMPSVVLESGETLHAGLILLATGLSERIRRDLGFERVLLSAQHSITLGFGLKRDSGFGFEGLVHQSEAVGDHMGYASLFPLNDVMRVNLFIFDDPKGERLKAFRADPLAALVAYMPKLKSQIAGARLVGPLDMRVAELYRIENPARNGIMLIGDARSTSCPSTGTGLTRILNEVRLLSRDYINQWLDQPDRGQARLLSFYQDKALTRLEESFFRRSMKARAMAVETGLSWRLKRYLRKARDFVRSTLSGMKKVNA